MAKITVFNEMGSIVDVRIVKTEEGTSINRFLKIGVSDKGKEVAEHLIAVKRIIESEPEEM